MDAQVPNQTSHNLTQVQAQNLLYRESIAFIFVSSLKSRVEICLIGTCTKHSTHAVPMANFLGPLPSFPHFLVRKLPSDSSYSLLTRLKTKTIPGK